VQVRVGIRLEKWLERSNWPGRGCYEFGMKQFDPLARILGILGTKMSGTDNDFAMFWECLNWLEGKHT
jgi:hypothetical protein